MESNVFDIELRLDNNVPFALPLFALKTRYQASAELASNCDAA